MDTNPSQLIQTVLLCGLALGIAFGALAQATRFCTMGAIADVVNFGDATRLRTWVWAALVALVGTQALIGLGGVDLSASIYTGRRLSWLAQGLGGLAFGFGMVLASGCASRAWCAPVAAA
ncbi:MULTISPECIES: YeeE/YedE thiosulfate transporter family protein [unclassified Methylibium]|uniref:YeeE/YedE thiosulfate transporter family protein n=1 Tax=Methylibium sp. T29 TaxID=1430884 RepID=UPI0003F46B35|nr:MULTISPECIES: YeeE/YedE thiosulfate transporter family protein [unclassified Methylibium]EWS54853.1 putative inner membrane protein [Methylibium sp. T29]EWS60201.1 putative inner membrane protein [Methylibium sp. T29-B]